jgi:hypothetical protein
MKLLRVNFLDKSIKNFLFLSQMVILIFALLLLIFGYIYWYSDIKIYNNILLIIIILTIIMTVVFAATIFALVYVYRKKYVNRSLLLPVRIGQRILLPFVIFISGVFMGSKDAVRGFYVDVNNILVRSLHRTYPSEQVLVLLPHCLQNSECIYKVTNNLNNCRRCGRCCIGEIALMAEEFKVNTMVVTGGTVARSVVSKSRPGVILSVACERDLAAGIADVIKIPVVGVVNERPNGPCYNTNVNVADLRKRLEEIIEK